LCESQNTGGIDSRLLGAGAQNISEKFTGHADALGEKLARETVGLVQADCRLLCMISSIPRPPLVPQVTYDEFKQKREALEKAQCDAETAQK